MNVVVPFPIGCAEAATRSVVTGLTQGSLRACRWDCWAGARKYALFMLAVVDQDSRLGLAVGAFGNRRLFAVLTWHTVDFVVSFPSEMSVDLFVELGLSAPPSLNNSG